MIAIVQIEMVADDGKILTVPVSLAALIREHIGNYHRMISPRKWTLKAETVRVDLKTDDGQIVDSIRVEVAS